MHRFVEHRKSKSSMRKLTVQVGAPLRSTFKLTKSTGNYRTPRAKHINCVKYASSSSTYHRSESSQNRKQNQIRHVQRMRKPRGVSVRCCQSRIESFSSLHKRVLRIRDLWSDALTIERRCWSHRVLVKNWYPPL